MRRNWIGGSLAWLWLIVAMVPIYWVVITSFKTQASYFITNTFAPPTEPILDNYQDVLEAGFVRYFLNSVTVSVGAVVPAVAVSFMAAYAIVRGAGNRWLRSINSVFMLGLAIPLQAVVIPVYLIIIRLQMYDTLAAIILPPSRSPSRSPCSSWRTSSGTCRRSCSSRCAWTGRASGGRCGGSPSHSPGPRWSPWPSTTR